MLGRLAVPKHFKYCWWEEGCRAASWRKNPLFEILFAAHIGTLVRFAGPPGQHSRLNHHAVLNFYVEILGDRFSAAFAVLTAEKHTRKIRGKFGEKIRRKKFVFRCVFRSVFCFSLATPYFEHFLTFKSKKFARNPFCKKFPLKYWGKS